MIYKLAARLSLLSIVYGIISAADQVRIRNADGSTTVLTGHYDQYGNPVITERYSPPPPEFPVGAAIIGGLAVIAADMWRKDNEQEAQAEARQAAQVEMQRSSQRKVEADRLKWEEQERERKYADDQRKIERERRMGDRLMALRKENMRLWESISELDRMSGERDDNGFSRKESALMESLKMMRENNITPSINDAERRISDIRATRDSKMGTQEKRVSELAIKLNSLRSAITKTPRIDVLPLRSVIDEWNAVKDTLMMDYFSGVDGEVTYINAVAKRMIKENEYSTSVVLFDVARRHELRRQFVAAADVYGELVKRNISFAMFNLGRLYAKGCVPDRDLKDAIPLWERAAVLGDEKSKAKILYFGYLGAEHR